MTAPDRITTEIDAALKDYTAGIDRAVRFVTIDQVDMLAEFYLHNRATKAQLAKAVDALIDTTTHLVAALSLLERGGKKAAPSNKMFDQMLRDYDASINRARAALAAAKAVQK